MSVASSRNDIQTAAERGDEARSELRRRRAQAESIGGPEAIRRQHQRGLLTAPERIAHLLDPGTDVPFGALVHGDDPATAAQTYGDGELVGFGRIEGRWVAYFATDPRVKGGSQTPATFRHADAFRNIVERAALPVCHLMQGGGARMTDAMSSTFLAFPGTGLGARRVFPRRGPLLTAVMGSYFAPWTVGQADFSVMTATSNISLTAPALVAVGTGQEVSAEELGGAEVQARTTGQIDAVVADDARALELIRRVFSYLPSRAGEPAPTVPSPDPCDRPCPVLRTVVPAQANRAYDVRNVIEEIVDAGSFLEWSPRYGPNLVTGLARFGSATAVIIANQPASMAGVLDVKAVTKITKVLRLAEDFSLPVVNLIDTPGVLPTKEQEHDRLMSRLFDLGVQRLKVRAPKVSIIMRKAIGFAMQIMSAGDPEGITAAWPDAQIAFTGPEAAARITYRREIEAAPDQAGKARELAKLFEGRSAPWEAAHLGYLDDVIEPEATRRYVISAVLSGRSSWKEGRQWSKR